MGGAPTVRPAEWADLAQVARIAAAGWRHAYAGLISEDAIAAMLKQWYSPEVLERRLERGGLDVAELVGEVVAFMQHARVSPAVHEVFALYADPLRLGEGAGWALWQRALALAEREKAECVELWVLEGNRLGIGWYERQQGVKVGEQTVEMSDGPHRELRYRFALPG